MLQYGIDEHNLRSHFSSDEEEEGEVKQYAQKIVTLEETIGKAQQVAEM